MSLTGKFLYMLHHFIFLWLNPFDLSLELIGRDGGLRTLRHSYGFPCQQWVLKTFSGPEYLHSKNEVLFLCHSPVNLYIWLTISSLCDSITLTLV